MPSSSRSKASQTTKSRREAPVDAAGAAGVASGSSLPKWPPLQPLVPAEHLGMDALLQDQIILIHNLFTTSLCKTYVSFLSSLPLITTPAKPKEGNAVRINDRFEVHDFGFAQRLWSSTGLAHVLAGSGAAEARNSSGLDGLKPRWGGELCGLNPRIRVYRYRKGHRFGPHYDESNLLTLPTTPPTLAKTTWTLLIYLTGTTTGCIGGETVFHPEPPSGRKSRAKSDGDVEPIVVGLEVGMALLHKHGQECLLHEGREVQEGEKWIIRSDLCVKR